MRNLYLAILFLLLLPAVSYAHKNHLTKIQLITQHSESESIGFAVAIEEDCPFTEYRLVNSVRAEIIRNRIRPVAAKNLSRVTDVLLLGVVVDCMEDRYEKLVHAQTNLMVWTVDHIVFIDDPEKTFGIVGNEANPQFLIQSIQNDISNKLSTFISAHMGF